MQKTKIILISLTFLILPLFVDAVSVGQELNFSIDPSYDLYGRKEISAVLQKISNEFYFYVDKEWWQKLDYSKKQSLDVEIYNLSLEFERNIYPKLTSTFGSEPKPGIDKDGRITILAHPMIKDAGGYFNSGDVYSKFQYPKSNEREMFYLNSEFIARSLAKSLLAHEFVHLITVNQKDLLRNAAEEIWLNEARAEYAPTLLGYDDIYEGSNLERRVSDFLTKPSDSLTEWLNKKEDYGALNLFTQYLVDHYGVKVLVDSLQSSKTGIDSLNYALEKNGFKKNFSQIFSDWTIAVLVNDCKLGEKYCYLNKNLKDLRITPTLYYLPKTETVLSTYRSATYWSADWYRFVGGGDNLSLEFEGAGLVEFEVFYLLCEFNNNCSVGLFPLDNEQKGKIAFSEFGSKYSSLTAAVFIKSKTFGFNGKENSFSFSWTASVQGESGAQREDETIRQLLTQIESLKSEIARVQAAINAILASRGQTEIGTGPISCQSFENNLYYGMSNSLEVRCLQEFLKAQGQGVYPEGLVTGNFLSLTQQAIIRFQEKHASEILVPLGLEKGNGYFGSLTRQVVNGLIKK